MENPNLDIQKLIQLMMKKRKKSKKIIIMKTTVIMNKNQIIQITKRIKLKRREAYLDSSRNET